MDCLIFIRRSLQFPFVLFVSFVVHSFQPWRRVVLNSLASLAAHSPSPGRGDRSPASATPSAQSRCVRVTPEEGNYVAKNALSRQNSAGPATEYLRRFIRAQVRSYQRDPAAARSASHSEGTLCRQKHTSATEPWRQNCSRQNPPATCHTKDHRKK
jgi:hypothetical protein